MPCSFGGGAYCAVTPLVIDDVVRVDGELAYVPQMHLQGRCLAPILPFTILPYIVGDGATADARPLIYKTHK